jgi:hypothetical protein
MSIFVSATGACVISSFTAASFADLTLELNQPRSGFGLNELLVGGANPQ